MTFKTRVQYLNTRDIGHLENVQTLPKIRPSSQHDFIAPGRHMLVLRLQQA